MTAAQLTWPGVDQQRALGACFHLTRALVAVQRARLYQTATGKYPIRSLGAASMNARIARGYLGAIGFEQGGRL